MKYDIDYFIKKFEAILEHKWHVGDFSKEEGTSFCALGHCGMRNGFKDLTNEALELNNMFLDLNTSVGNVNDDFEECATQYGKHPKTRILNFLKMI